MSLQDEHLQQALKQAPDHDLAPSDAVREKVFAHAEAAMQPKVNWVVRWFNGLSHLHWVGMSAVASAVIVMLMVYPQMSEDSIWSSTEEADIALSESIDLEVVEAPEESAMPPTMESEAYESEPVLVDKAMKKEKAPASAANKVERSTNKVEPRRFETNEEQAQPSQNAPEQLDKQTVLPASEAEGLRGEGAFADDLPIVRATDAKPKPSTAATPRLAPEVKTADRGGQEVAAGLSSAFSGKALSGSQLAQQDIARGHFRILLAAEAWPEEQSMVDDETGFTIELSNMSAAEVVDYNNTIKNWYRTNQQSK